VATLFPAALPPELSSELSAVVERYVPRPKPSEAMFGHQMDIKIVGRLTNCAKKASDVVGPCRSPAS
jgi:hypothetical protein